jgi:hypothetical protein
MNLDVGPKARAKLEALSGETEQSYSEILRNALAVYATLWSELKKGGSLIIRGTDSEKELILPELQP